MRIKGPYIAIGNRKGGGVSWPVYWSTRYPMVLTAIVSSATQINLAWTNNGVADYDDIRIERSSDGITYVEIHTSTIGDVSYSNSSLTTEILYFYRIRYRKGTNYSDYSNIAFERIPAFLSNLVDYWKMDESSGNATGVNGNVLTNNNTVTYAAAKINNGADFGTGNTNKSLTINSALGLTYNSSRSVSLWVKINAAPATNAAYALASILFATNPGGYSVIFYRDTANVKQLSFNNTVHYNTTLTNGVWYHIVMTWNQAGNEAKMYLNGVLVITDTVFQGNYSALTTRFAVGNFNAGSFANAVIDEVGYFNTILTLPQVTFLYNQKNGIQHPFSYANVNGERLLTSAAHCWFNSPISTFSPTVNKTFIGMVHNDGSGYSQHVLTLNNATGIATTFEVGSVVESDDHNEPSVLIRSSDSKLFTTYSEHAGAAIRWRISTNALDASAWGAESTADPDNPRTYTYCNSFEVTNGDIYIFFRASDATTRWEYIKSTDGGATFGVATIFSNATYHRIFQNQTNKNIIHFIGVAHPNELLTPNNIDHFYFNAGTGTWHKSDGTDITALVPLDYTEATIIFTTTTPAQPWIEDLILDTNGYPRALLTYMPNQTIATPTKYLYYTEWNGSTWSTPYQIHQASHKNAYATQKEYPPLAYFDRNNANRIIASKEVSDAGQLEIYELTRVSASSFTSVKKTTSLYDQWRPIVTKAPSYNVIWLNKIAYTSYTNFNQELMVKTM